MYSYVTETTCVLTSQTNLHLQQPVPRHPVLGVFVLVACQARGLASLALPHMNSNDFLILQPENRFCFQRTWKLLSVVLE
jgi:hypothetical protein